MTKLIARARAEYSFSTVNWLTAAIMVLFHVGAVAAFWFTTWTNVVVALVLHWFAVGLGISLGYHRLHTHRGFKTSKAFEYFLAVCGTLTLEGGPIFWVATHRVHHQHSDQDGDPHTPRDGGFWAHMGWILFGDTHHNDTAVMSKYAPDLGSDPFYRWLNTYHYVPLTVVGFVLLAIGGWPMVLWGIFLRVVFGLHGTWLVNSATHMWGSRRFMTRDDSRNSWWVALLTFGEGWHNNHHAHPVSARHGLAWYEFDMTWITLKVLKAFGIVREVKAATIRRVPAQHDSFINAVTHELKTPIASIRLYLQTLQTRDLDEAKRREFYRIMLEDSDRLLQTVEQVLRAGSSGSRLRRIVRARVNLDEIARECVELARTRFHLDPDALAYEQRLAASHPVVLGDPEELRAAVWNLIDNAVKYSAGELQIRVTLEETEGRLALRVSDRGVGISPAELKRIFRRFYRIPASVLMRTKGSGLGLFIVRSVARRHGGRAFAESEGAGRGSTFTLILPRAPATVEA